MAAASEAKDERRLAQTSPDRLAAAIGVTRRADLQRVGPHWLGNVLQRHRTEIAYLEIKSRLDLSIGVV